MAILCRLILLVILVLGYQGCATVPPPGLKTYNLQGTTYVSLKSLCETLDIQWQWDDVNQVVTLQKDNRFVSVMVDSPIVYTGGRYEKMARPVRNIDGAVMVPWRFKEQFIGDLIVTSRPIIRAAPDALAPGYTIRKIVIDPGHGGKDPGAIGRGGIREKDLVLDIARRLRNLLRRRGFEVIMTRDRDVFISLSRRADIANQAKADLFVSIHANANRSRWIRGIEIYHARGKSEKYVSGLVDDRDSAYILNDLRIDKGSRNTRAIVLDLVHTQNQADALSLAECIANSAQSNLEVRDKGIRAASFYVLKNTQIPAILVEIGYITNAREAKYLKSNSYRQDIVEAIAKGIASYKERCLLGRRKK